MNTDQLSSTTHAIKDKETRVVQSLDKRRENAAQRFPLLFTLLGSFGLVATFYGFEGIINRIDLLANHPFILLGTGVGVLVATGTLYKKLG
jgi:hypothetical protein